MNIKHATYYISIDELLIAFGALPANTDNRLRFISLAMPLPDASGQLTKYALQFDWNISYQDWELSKGQPIIVTAKNRLAD